MPSLSSTLGLAVRSMQVSQTGLSTISHNISNVNTPGYARQEVIQGATAVAGFGSGVDISSIRRTVDSVLQNNLVDQTSDLAYNKTLYADLKNAEVLFSQPGNSNGIESLMNNFFDELSNLANYPDSSSQRIGVVTAGQFIVDSVNQIQQGLESLQLQIDQRIKDELTSVNDALQNISDLNQQIVAVSSNTINGANANDLIDERERTIEFIAEYIPINVTYSEEGRARLTAENGRTLVDYSAAQLEEVPFDPAQAFSDLGIRPTLSSGIPSNQVFPMELDTNRITSGRFKALADLRDSEIPDLMAEMDEFARVVISEFNAIHSQGTGVPPVDTFTSGNGDLLSSAGADLVTELGLQAGSTFNVSVVDADGNMISTTLAAGGGAGGINLGAGPITYANIAAAINGNADVGGTVNASVTVDADGNPQLQVQETSGNFLVLADETGNMLSAVGMNNFFTGRDASTMAIRADIVATPELVASARMRESDGGLSLYDNRNAIALSELATTDVAFGAAGDIGATSTTLTGYYNDINGTLAVELDNANDRQEFVQKVYDDISERIANTSGVNMDEELANMMLFQNAFQASARVITTIDELYDTLLQIV